MPEALDETAHAPDDRLPRWFAASLRAALALVAAGSIVGVLLAMAGRFQPAAMALLTTLLALPWAVLVVRRTPASGARRSDHLAAVAALALAVAAGAWNVQHHAAHVTVDRDPGIYVTTARWLVDNGDLTFDGLDGPFADQADLRPHSVGFAADDDGDLLPQFPHLLGVALATAGWVSARLIFLANPVIGSFALLTVFAAATRVVRPWPAVAATALTATTFPFIYLTRDAYSEPLAMALLFGGLWLLRPTADTGRAGAALCGALLGAGCMVRIDGLVPLIPLVGVLVLLARAPGDGEATTGPGFARWAVAAAAATAAIGIVDTWQLSPSYFSSDLAPRLPLLLGGVGASAAAAWILGPRLWPPRTDAATPSTPAPTMVRRVLGALAALGLAAFIAWVAVLRPDDHGLPDLAIRLSEAQISVLSVSDELADLSYRWLAWYLGEVGAAVGLVVVAAAAVSALVRGTARSDLALPAAVLVPTLLYLSTPNISADQPWAMRRFTAVTIPGLLVAVAWVVDRLWDRRPRRAGLAGPLLGAALLAVVAWEAGSTTAPLRSTAVQAPGHAMVEWVCEVIGEEPAAVVIAPVSLLDVTFAQPVAAWCGVPAAGARLELGDDDVRQLARAWAAEGRALFVVSEGGPRWDVVEVRGARRAFGPFLAPEVTLTGAPSRLVEDVRAAPDGEGEIDLWVAQVQVEP